MYKVEKFMIPDGYKLGEYTRLIAKEIIEGRNVEENKDKLFRMTYPVMYEYVMKFDNLYSEEYLVSDMAIAFMKTLSKFNPDMENNSFINYYKLTVKSVIFNNYYGKYKKDEESRKLKRETDNLTTSLEEPVSDKHGKNTGTWHDLTPDDKFEIDTDIIKKCTHEDIYQAIDIIFTQNGRGKKTARAKKIYTETIDNILFDKRLRQIDIGEQNNVSKSAVCRLQKRYDALLKEELIKRGY